MACTGPVRSGDHFTLGHDLVRANHTTMLADSALKAKKKINK